MHVHIDNDMHVNTITQPLKCSMSMPAMARHRDIYVRLRFVYYNCNLYCKHRSFFLTVFFRPQVKKSRKAQRGSCRPVLLQQLYRKINP